jgi:GT2 family glycosyltransferase
MQIYWEGYGGSKHLAEELRPLIESLDCTLITISEWKDSNIIWNRLTWLQELKKADAIIIPCNYIEQSAKSNNRLTQSMSLGKPCIVNPLPAYLRIIEKYPGCALVATTQEEWKQHIEYLKDPIHRQEISKIALEASKEYSLGEITKKWVSLFNDLQKIDIIIPVYNNVEYLKMCLDSIRKNSAKLYNIIISDSGSDQKTWDYYSSLNDITILGKQSERLNYSQACNVAIKSSNSKYFVILNSDVIVSKNWDLNLLDKMQKYPDLAVCGVLSNCDRGWRFTTEYNMRMGDLELVPGMKASQLENKINELYSFMERSNKEHEGKFVTQEWVAYYGSIFNRDIVNKVGLLDPKFMNGHEDLDHCVRISKMGFKIGQAIDCFVYHFGGITRGGYEQEGKQKYREEDKANADYFEEKWGKLRKSIVIYSSMSWEKWDYKNIENGGIGGSEIWQIYLSREFDKLGYKVINFNDCAEDCKDGNIQYLHYSKLPEFLEYNWVDFFISSRTEEPFQYNIRSGKNFIISHDVWLLSGQQIKYQNKINKYLCLSDWHKTFFSQHHNIPLEKIHITSNGIDLSRFDDVKVERNPYRLHWSSSWDRGLDNVLYLWPFIKQQVPEAELHCYYGVFNWKQSCLQKNDQNGLKKIAELEEKVKQPGIFTYGRVSQKELAIEISKASLLLYPSWFSETFFITGIECQYARVPIICNKYAGVITTLKDSAIMLGDGSAWWPYTKEGREQFFTETVSILKDKEKWNKWADLGRENAKNYSWEKVAKKWVDEILK